MDNIDGNPICEVGARYLGYSQFDSLKLLHLSKMWDKIDKTSIKDSSLPFLTRIFAPNLDSFAFGMAVGYCRQLYEE